MDPFSPVAQSQLAEFDILRDQMENPLNGSETQAKNNIGKFLRNSALFQIENLIPVPAPSPMSVLILIINNRNNIP